MLSALMHPTPESQESSVQTLPSSQSGGAPPTQMPAAHVSVVVQASLSSHGAMLFVFTHPVPESQESSVQTLPSSQFGGAPPTQTPAAQVSFRSEDVQTLPSSQFGGAPPRQAPAAHVSFVVQASLSSQGDVLFVFTHPVPESQESSVQTLPSSQFGGAPPTQTPAAQVSFVVQALLSSQGAMLFVFTHPVPASQESSVQILPSSQLGGAPPTQTPSEQISAVVHASLSSQGTVLSALIHPIPESHESSVQTLASSQSGAAPPMQMPAEHVSLVVQASPSSHGAVLFVFTHPVPGSQVSSVQTSPSSQSGAGPPTQAPPEQVSSVVQASASSHGTLLGMFWQPTPESHRSMVQILASSQSGGAPPAQTPNQQASLVVQALPSSQGTVLSALTHPMPESQESSVQMLPSSQSGGAPPTQMPAEQVSFVVHASLSSQGTVLSV
jgi:hypothetical protein